MKLICFNKYFILIGLLTLVLVNNSLANEEISPDDNLFEKENNFFQSIFHWFLDLFESETAVVDSVESTDSPKLDALHVIEEQSKEGKPKHVTNETCDGCKIFDINWTRQECFSENFICPADVKGKSLGCMPAFPNRDYAKFCVEPCLSWIIETCGFEGYNS
ncbi:hypothetical protein HOF78_01790 [Candidatus Woesearchaeota archaeon]|nr:hypothetical protein [Candidatus Woesearchaeota archaeon]